MAYSKKEFYSPIIQEFASLLKPLGHAARIQILMELIEKPMTAKEMEANQPLHHSTVSKHLAKLVEAGYVKVDKHRMRPVYVLDESSVPPMSMALLKGMKKLMSSKDLDDSVDRKSVV